MSNLSLTENELKDRLLGMVFGCALGDAFGLPAEGTDPSMIKERGGLIFPYKNPVRGFPLNDWSDDTDLSILVMRTFTSYRRNGVIDPASDFANRLVKWIQGGFSELGDTIGMGCGALTHRVASHENFVDAPFEAAEKAVGPKAGNGALMRISPCAFMPENRKWAEFMCRVTHSDPRCSAACIAQAAIVRTMAEWRPGAVFPMKAFKQALASGLDYLGDEKADRDEFLAWARGSKDLAQLDLNTRDGRGYVYRTFACGIWAVREIWKSVTEGKKRDADLFRDLITTVASEGGDADTNAAVVGAIAGAAIGYDNLPKDWLNALPFKAFLERETGFFLSTL